MGWDGGGRIDKTKLPMFDGQPSNGSKAYGDLFMSWGWPGTHVQADRYPKTGEVVARNR